ncbi:hypothetical protein C5B42_00685 [Candidatus Cerribacteria bacterium 'Amazon FNV 2010 28 9']|uniref:Polymerase nucleotidyl transferase domain-containing protein n=1 Tax=Candidatus Cerribacteria bacterium 'Amazon FNV 2010 28 9' TaxID=2081795 RepID=A0A317JU23_9BACT|nr:MAG: hypothetical protein C5B42_00685 [Candidatus Cerribacteria bacterium 'Amazon FNV 2010 28 9']
MNGIKPHTHEERTAVIDKLIPVIKSQLGDNLLGLASGGSFARGEDIDYSDLELVAFIKQPLKSDWEIRKIVDGLYIVVVADTKEGYISKYLDITDIWYASGGDKLKPIINEELINELNAYKPTDIEQKCLAQIEKRWHLFQEITAKTLNTLKLKNQDGLPIILSQMVKELLVILSYLNQTPYITLGKYITQAKQFSVKPEGTNTLFDLFTSGKYQDLSSLDRVTKTIFSSLESDLEQKGLRLYTNEL